MRNTIFISYSHTDKEWLERFEKALNIGVARELYDTWSDQQIPPGEEWDSTIEGKIASARTALLLVTPEFLQSSYIGRRELPTILDRHRQKGLTLHWVPIKSVSDVKLKIANLDGIQALSRPDQPLAEMDSRDCKKAIESICDKLIKVLNPLADINNQAIGELETELKEKLGKTIVLGPQIAFGDGSIIYKAKEENEDIAVKMALPSMRRAWVATDFVSRANRFRQIVDPLFVRIRKAHSDAQINWVTMDYVDLPSLKDLICQSGKPGLQFELVAKVLAQVSLAASNLHEESRSPNDSLEPLLVGPLRSSHIYCNPQNGKIKISPTQMSPATLQSAQARPLCMLQEDELTWLAPSSMREKELKSRRTSISSACSAWSC